VERNNQICIEQKYNRLKKVLIISPYFPPDNTADMHRVRQSLPYYSEYGWQPLILCVDSIYTEAFKDPVLAENIPENISITRVKALPSKITRKLGLGSIALRSLWNLYQAGNEIIKKEKPDLIFFSTTQFPVMILGSLWKKKWGIPYILDFQDPWHTDHYLSLPKNQRPSKFWFSYRLNKFLEPKAVKYCDGLMAVTEAYIQILKNRYPQIEKIPATTLPFGASVLDLNPAFEKLIPDTLTQAFNLHPIKFIYTGVINKEMLPVISLILKAFKSLLLEDIARIKETHFYFIGTSYGSGKQLSYKLKGLIQELNLENYVSEFPERVSYLATLQIQKKADILLLPGTIDKDYVASKLATYLLSGNPVLTLYHSQSTIVQRLKKQKRIEAVFFEDINAENLDTRLAEKMSHLLQNSEQYRTTEIIDRSDYDAQLLTQKQCSFFDQVQEESKYQTKTG